MTHDLQKHERSVELRCLRPDDYDALIAMEQRCFPGMAHWSREQVQSQLSIFPEGQLVIEIDGRIAASAASLVVDFDRYEDWHDWKRISDSGYIRNHSPKGDTMYGIEIMVDPEYRGMRLARRLYDERKRLAREMNLRRVVIAGRIPGYGAHAASMSAREYIERVRSKDLFDPVLTPQLANDFHLEGLIPDYLPVDTDSRGYATYLEWTNLDYRNPKDDARDYDSPQVRLCLVQFMMRKVASFEEFARQCEFFVDVAGNHRCDLLVFPELFTLALLSLVPPERPGLAARRLAGYTPQFLDLFTDLAVRYNVNIVGGSHFVVEDETLYNAAYLFRRNGSIARQLKLHITPNEARWWGVSPGHTLEVFPTDCGPLSIQVCYDVEFPELSRIACARGAQIIAVPFNTDERRGYLRVRHCAQARAIENQVYVAIAGCTGNLPQVENADVHYSQCAVLTPSDFPFARDAVAAEASPNIETLVIQDVDLDLLRRNRSNGTVRPWTDRRTDLYRLLVTERGREEIRV